MFCKECVGINCENANGSGLTEDDAHEDADNQIEHDFENIQNFTCVIITIIFLSAQRTKKLSNWRYKL